MPINKFISFALLRSRYIYVDADYHHVYIEYINVRIKLQIFVMFETDDSLCDEYVVYR